MGGQQDEGRGEKEVDRIGVTEDHAPEQVEGEHPETAGDTRLEADDASVGQDGCPRHQVAEALRKPGAPGQAQEEPGDPGDV